MDPLAPTGFCRRTGVESGCVFVSVLFKLDPMLSLIVFVGLGGIYLAIYWVVRCRLRTVGTVKAEANAARFRALSEASGAIKEINCSTWNAYSWSASKGQI